MPQLVITAVGPDRSGLVDDFTGHLHAAGANIADSRMVNLRGQFALVLLAEGSDAVLAELERSLADAGRKSGLAVSVIHPAHPGAAHPGEGSGGAGVPPAINSGVGSQMAGAPGLTPAPPAGVPYKLKTYSMDQPGIIHRVAHLLRSHGVNIEELQSRQESVAFMGTPLFTMEMRLTVPPTVSVRQLRGELQTLCDSLNCDVDLEPA